MPVPPEIFEPIPGDHPAGTEVRYEPVYGEIKDAREEEAAIPQGDWQRERKTADYAKVVKLATQVLTEQSKDLQVAAWMAEALLYREGFGGFAEGIDAVRRIMIEFWDGCFPEIDDGDLEYRAAPLEWLANYTDFAVRKAGLNQAGHDFLEYKQSRAMGYEEEVEGDSDRQRARQEAIAEGKLPPEAFDESFAATGKAWYKQLVADLDAVVSAIDTLEGESDERFGDVAPSFRKLRDAVGEVQHVAGRLLAKKLETDPDPVEVQPTVEVAVESSGAETPSSAATSPQPRAAAVSAEPGSVDDAAQRVAGVARYLRAKAPGDPTPYLLLRALRWGELRACGDHLDPKLLAAPPTEARTRLKTLLLDGEWAGLVEACEEVMSSPYGRGWLDLQRYVLTGLEGLGGRFEPAARAVKGALRSLLEDVPALPDQTLMDDSPTANRETLAWLRDEAIASDLSEAVEAELAEQRGSRRPVGGPDVMDRAMAKVRAGQPQLGIEILMRAAEQESSERMSFLRRSEAASLMVDAGLEGVALPILREMIQEIDEHKLEEWEDGETVARPLGLLYRCIGKLEGETHERQELYLRVCRLDPMQAIDFQAGAGAEPPEATAEPQVAADEAADG